MPLEKIQITGELRLLELDRRLREVRLKGFPDVRIYESADIEIKEITRDELLKNVFTPQPSIYVPHLKRIAKMAEIFRQEGIDIFKMHQGYDYIATDSEGNKTNWTLIPPVVEAIAIKAIQNSGLDYSSMIGLQLRKAMNKQRHKLNPELKQLNFPEYKQFEKATHSVPIICDGSHRIHAGLERKTQHIILIDGTKPGFPYYAAPKPYSVVHVEEERPEKGSPDKTHVLTSPGHKLLYRLFPSGGILSGDVRPTKVAS